MSKTHFELTPEFFSQIHDRYGDAGRFVEEFRARMKEHKVSAARVARRSGFHPPHISRWLGENRSVLPSMETMVLLDETLNRIIAERSAG